MDITDSIDPDIALDIHIVAMAPISMPTAMAKLISTPRSSLLRDQLNFTIVPRRHVVTETINSRCGNKRLREPFRSTALKRLLSIQSLSRSLWQGASSQPPSSQAMVRLATRPTALQTQILLFFHQQNAASYRLAPPHQRPLQRAPEAFSLSCVSICRRRRD